MKTSGLTSKKKLLLVEVMATIALFSILLVSVGTIFLQLKTSRQEIVSNLLLMEAAQNLVFEQKRKIYQNPIAFLEIKEQEMSVDPIYIEKSKVLQSVQIKNVTPRKKELSKTYLLTLHSKVQLDETKKQSRYAEKVLITEHLTK